MGTKIYVGNCLDVLKTLETGSVHCCIGSPPYWNLRDYGTAEWEGGDPDCDHKVGRFERPVSAKQKSNAGSAGHQARDVCPKCGAKRVDEQLGHEPLHDCLGWATGNECGRCYVGKIVAIFREVWRVLRDDGSVLLNLGDTYARSGGPRPAGLANTGNNRRISWPSQRPPGSLKAKDLAGIPWRVAFALQADGWWLRQDIIWDKDNPMPEPVTDRCVKGHEYVFLLAKSEHYYFDHYAIQEPAKGSVPAARRRSGAYSAGSGRNDAPGHRSGGFVHGKMRNKRSVWRQKLVATRWKFCLSCNSFFPKGIGKMKSCPTCGETNWLKHFATYPAGLVIPMIEAGTSARGCCSECGAPWERVVEKKASKIKKSGRAKEMGIRICPSGTMVKPPQAKTVGWRPTCDCDADPVPCTVLDPFIGSGTTAVVAKELGRDCIGIDLSPDYARLALARVANSMPLFDVEVPMLVQLEMPNIAPGE